MKPLPALLSILAVALSANGQAYVAAASSSGPAAAKTADSVTLSGTVVDGNGAPVAGAAVRAYERDPRRPAEDAAVLRSEAVTKADGAFELGVPRGDESGYSGMVMARKEGLAVGWVNFWNPGMSRDLRITLHAPAALGGTVADEAGKPVAGAKVLALFVSGGARRGLSLAQGGLSVDWLIRTTDGRGRFTFADMPDKDAKADFYVLAEGFAPAQTREKQSSRNPMGQFAPGQADIKITLSPEARVEGTVVEKATGRPVAGAPIALTTESFQGIRRTRSDANGRFLLAGLPAGACRLCYATAAQFPLPGNQGGMSYRAPFRWPPEWVSPMLPLDLTKGKATSARLELTQGAILLVAVQDKASRGPVDGAWITVRDEGDSVYYGACDANGTLAMRVVPGRYSLSSAAKEGYGPVHGDLDEAKRAAVLRQSPSATFETVTADAVEGQTAVLAVALAPGPRITGVVKDRGGKPVAGAQVGSLFGYSMFGGGLGPTTDANGVFSLPSDTRMQPLGGPGVMLMARDANRGLVGASQAAPGERVEITILPGVMAAGLVADPNGTPIPKAKVSLVIWYGQSGMGQPAEPAGPDGRYRVGPLIPGIKYTVQAEAPGYGQMGETLRPQGDEPNGIAVPNLVLPLARMTLSGVVLDADGNTVPSARIYVQGQGQAFREAESDEKGQWKLIDIIDGKVEVSANLSDSQRQLYGRASARGGDSNVVIVLREQGRGGMVASTPKSLAGQPLPDLRKLGLKSAEELAGGKRLLVVLWDATQRPSRRCVQGLAARAEELKGKGLAIVLIHPPAADANAPAQWLADQKIALPAGVTPSDPKAPGGADPMSAWGAKGLPWLVLTDEKLIVRQEGFAVEELDAKLAGSTAAPSATQPVKP